MTPRLDYFKAAPEARSAGTPAVDARRGAITMPLPRGSAP